MPVPVVMFPEVRHTGSLDKRLFNEVSQRYVCVLPDNNNSLGLLATKTIVTHADVDVEFRLHYFSSAELEEGKMVLIVHKATGVCLTTNEDNKLALFSLHDGSPDSNLLREADPQQITRADSRFFYVHSSGLGRDSYVIKSTSGAGDNLYLFISDNGVDLSLKKLTGRTFAPEMRFIFRK